MDIKTLLYHNCGAAFELRHSKTVLELVSVTTERDEPICPYCSTRIYEVTVWEATSPTFRLKIATFMDQCVAIAEQQQEAIREPTPEEMIQRIKHAQVDYPTTPKIFQFLLGRRR